MLNNAALPEERTKIRVFNVKREFLRALHERAIETGSVFNIGDGSECGSEGFHRTEEIKRIVNIE